MGGAIGRFIANVAADDPPKWVRNIRSWSFAVGYCAVVETIGATTLLIRPFLPQVTGRTFPTYDTVAECYPLAGLMLLGVLLATVNVEFGGLIFVLLTAALRAADALNPLSIVSVHWYVFLCVWQCFRFVGVSPMVWAARRFSGGRGVHDAAD